jgi:mannose-6-phosphate isomerase-like protein (cupin superfamily)
MMSLDPSETYVLLGSNGAATSLPGGGAFWSQAEAALESVGKNWLISEFECATDWNSWEMHPHADEFVYLLSGSATLLFEMEGGLVRVPLVGRAAVLVPKGTWHTAEVREPSRMLFVTMGAETVHKPGKQRDA